MNERQNITSQKRIAKNTLLLYFRMLLLTAVSLYTSRVILDALGVDDYGIYNVVGGVVTMFLVLSGSLSAAITRFLNIEMGKGNDERLVKVFSSSVTIQLLIALLVLVLAETIGLWFVNTQLVIPDDRLTAANWCYQFSLLTFCINLISIPYNSAIIAHEKMEAFAYISIFDAVGRLAIALTIVFSPVDKLVYYSGLIALLSIIIRFVYVRYCNRHFEECNQHLLYDKALFKEMFSFVGWNLIGASSFVLRDHGGTILTNLFFSPSVNAARALAMKVNTVITGFVQNFMMAMNPQITKSYAAGEYKSMMHLAFMGSRFSFYILLLITLPILMSTKTLLMLWLKEVPDYTVIFIRLIFLLSLSESLSNPLITMMLATGKIRNYQIVVGGLFLLNIPVAYLLLKQGLGPEVVLLTAIVLSQLGLLARLVMLRPMVNLSIIQYLKQVYIRVLAVTLTASLIPVVVSRMIHQESIAGSAVLMLLAILCTLLSVYFVGCNQHERLMMVSKCKQVLKKLHHA